MSGVLLYHSEMYLCNIETLDIFARSVTSVLPTISDFEGLCATCTNFKPASNQHFLIYRAVK